MLKNARHYFDAKVGVDTAENEPRPGSEKLETRKNGQAGFQRTGSANTAMGFERLNQIHPKAIFQKQDALTAGATCKYRSETF